MLSAAPYSSKPAFSFPVPADEILELIDRHPPTRHRLLPVTRRKPVPPVVMFPQVQALSALELLTGRWTLQVLWALRSGPVRLGQLHRLFPSSSKKVLTQTLRKLEERRMLYRQDLSGRVRHVEYHLAPEMRTEVCTLLDQLERWGDACRRNGMDAAR